jgi:hypothetical protein
MPEPAKTVWDKDKAYGDAERAATSFDDSSADFDSTSVFFDGFDTTGLTKEGEAPAEWTPTDE